MNELDIRNLRLADFGHNLNKTRQTLSDVILQEGDGVAVIPTLAKKITSELAEVNALANTDYLTHPLSFDLVEDEANHLLVSVNVSIELSLRVAKETFRIG